jgi:hypothetical protein
MDGSRKGLYGSPRGAAASQSTFGPLAISSVPCWLRWWRSGSENATWTRRLDDTEYLKELGVEILIIKRVKQGEIIKTLELYSKVYARFPREREV